MNNDSEESQPSSPAVDATKLQKPEEITQALAAPEAHVAFGLIYTVSIPDEPLRQCEILSDVIQTILSIGSLASETHAEIESIKHPFALIITQDCDLEQDFAARNAVPNDSTPEKLLPDILLYHVATAEEIYAITRPKGRDIWKRIMQNKDERYHFLQKVEPSEDAQHVGLPELGIDFKRYFTVPTSELYARLKLGVIRRCRLNSPYLEHLSSRFAHFLSRVALPLDHISE